MRIRFHSNLPCLHSYPAHLWRNVAFPALLSGYVLSGPDRVALGFIRFPCARACVKLIELAVKARSVCRLGTVGRSAALERH